MARKQKSEKELVVSSGAAAAAAPRRKTTTRPKHSLTQAETPSTPIVELSSAQSASAAAIYEPTYDEISQQAYLYWEARGCQGGSPEDDWLRAEQELRARVLNLTA